MPTHGGQIAFIGGHRLESETDPWIVARREFKEETSLDPVSISFLGHLPVVMTARFQPIAPVMAKLLMTTQEFMRDVKSNGEWDDILAYPWNELTKEENWEFAWRNSHSQLPVLFHPIRRKTYISKGSDFHTHLLWGATASMVWDFLRLYYKD